MFAASLDFVHLKAVAVNVSHVVQKPEKQAVPVIKVKTSSLLEYREGNLVASQGPLEVFVRVGGAMGGCQVMRETKIVKEYNGNFVVIRGNILHERMKKGRCVDIECVVWGRVRDAGSIEG